MGLAGVFAAELKVIGCFPAARELGGGLELRATDETLVAGGG